MESTSTDWALFICSRDPPAAAVAWGGEPVIWGGGNCTSRASAVQDTWVLSRAVSNSRFTGGAAAKASKPIFPQLFSAKLLIPGFAQLRAAHRRHASMPVQGSRASSQAGNAAAEQVQISRAEHSSKLLQGKLMKCRAPWCTLCRKHIIFSNTAEACRRVTAVHRASRSTAEPNMPE